MVKRLKKRELECQALWDTIKDMINMSGGEETIAIGQVLEAFGRRALDTKAKRKLDIQD